MVYCMNHPIARSEIAGPRSRFYVYFISLVAAVGGFLLTYDIVIMSGAIIFMKKEFSLSPLGVGFAMTSAMIACFFSPSFGGWLCDKLGRKRTLLLSAVLFGASSIGTALPRTMLEFNVFRILGGIGVGAACIVSPMYIAEISPAPIRGRLVLLNQLANVVGALVSYLVAYLLSFSGAWRWMFGSTAIPVALFAIGLFFIPESPRWLVVKNREEEALDVLTRIGGRVNAQSELQSIRESLVQETGKLRDLLAPGIRMALIIAVGLAVLQQLDGVTVLIFYAPMIMQQAGFPQASEAIRITMIVGIWNLFCTLAAVWLVDRVGRRPLLLYGTLGMAGGLICMGAFFYLHITGVLVPVILMVAVAAYCMSIAPVTWLIMSEIFPNRLRGTGMAVASTALWIASFVANLVFPVMTSFSEHHFGSAFMAFWTFALICLGTFYFCWRLVPETKGRTLEEIGKSWTVVEDQTPLVETH
jgi:MFS transporter, SP family, arabinose:H+ symporter